MRTFPNWAHYELRNWSRYCWMGENPMPSPKTHCRSIEHRYMTPFDEADEKPIPIDVRSAEYLDMIIRQLPVMYRKVLFARYPRWLGDRAHAAKQCGVREQEFVDLCNQAGWRVVDALNGRKTG